MFSSSLSAYDISAASLAASRRFSFSALRIDNTELQSSFPTKTIL
jgi:hypothetical protein